MLIIFLSVILIVGFLIFMTWLFYQVFFNRESKFFITGKGTKIYKVDLKNRKIFSYKIESNKRALFDMKEKLGVWTPINNIFEIFESDEVQRLFRNAFFQLETGLKHHEISFVTKKNQSTKKTAKKKITQFNVVFDALEDDSDFIMTINWKPFKEESKVNFKAKFLSYNDVINFTQPWKGFVALNINSETENAIGKIIQFATRIYKKEISFFTASGFVIFIFLGNSNKEVKGEIDKFVDRFKENGLKSGFNHLYEGSAYAILNGVDTQKTLNSAVQTLDFLINISIENKIAFVTNKKDFNQDDFDNFVDASKIFRLALRSGAMKIKFFDVNSWKSGDKKLDYIFPEIESINQKLLSRILRNKNNKDSLMDAFASLISIDKKIDQPVLIDVNLEWLINNREKIKYKKAIYVINFNQNKDSTQLLKIVDILSKKGFVFALRIKKYNEEIATIIQNIFADFMIIDSSFWSENGLFNSDTLISLMTIKKIVDQADIKLIFENPSNIIDDITAEKIGLNFYYKRDV